MCGAWCHVMRSKVCVMLLERGFFCDNCGKNLGVFALKMRQSKSSGSFQVDSSKKWSRSIYLALWLLSIDLQPFLRDTNRDAIPHPGWGLRGSPGDFRKNPPSPGALFVNRNLFSKTHRPDIFIIISKTHETKGTCTLIYRRAKHFHWKPEADLNSWQSVLQNSCK